MNAVQAFFFGRSVELVSSRTAIVDEGFEDKVGRKVVRKARTIVAHKSHRAI